MPWIEKLSARERDIIVCVNNDAELSLKRVAKLTGYREHEVRYTLKRLLDREILRPRTFLNLYPLGYQQFKIYFSLGTDKGVARERLIKAIEATPQVAWLAELSGSYQYGFSIFVRTVDEAVDFLEGLAVKHQTLFFDKSVVIVRDFNLFPWKFLSQHKFPFKPLTLGGALGAHTIDLIDHKILIAIRDHGTPSLAQMAREAGVPASTIQYRIQRLRKIGVIVRQQYTLVGLPRHVRCYRVSLFTRGLNPVLRAQLFDFAMKHPNIVFFESYLGPWDYELGVFGEHASDITRTTAAIYDLFSASISSINVSAEIDVHKVNFYPLSANAIGEATKRENDAEGVF